MWREELVPPSSGISGKPIIFGSYGTGAPPIINGSDVISLWTSDAGGVNVWNAIVAKRPNEVFLDGARMMEGTSKSALTQHQWYWSEGTLSFYESAGNPIAVGDVLTASQRDYVVNTNGERYLYISGLTLTAANQIDLFFGGNTQGLTVFGNNISLAYGDGPRNQSSSMFTSSTITGNTIHDNGASGIQLVTSGVTTNTISGSAIYYNSQIYSASIPDHTYSGGVYLWRVGTGNVLTRNISYRNGYLDDNVPVTAVGVGLWFDTVATGNTISYSVAHDNSSGGIRVEDSADCAIIYNVTYFNNNAANFPAGVAVLSYNGLSPTSSNLIYSNFGYSNYYGLYFSGAGTGTPDFFINNFVQNNVFTGSSGHCGTSIVYECSGGKSHFAV
jgi:hypothetical protein